MSLPDSLSALVDDEAVRQREFPVVGQKVFLAHAAVCPLPRAVVGALTTYLAQVGQGGQFEHLHAQAEAEARALAASLLEASPDEIAFVPSTSAGLGLIAAGLDWKPGDSVVIAEGDFPANVYPWLYLERRGVRVIQIPTRGDGWVTLADVQAHLDSRTRLVALSSVHFATGARMDIDAIGEFLRGRGVLFCVDAIQSLGAVPLTAQYADFIVADAHKWLLGPPGIGVLFVRRDCFDTLPPVLIGWKSVVGHRDYTHHKLELADTARRYEPGSLNALGLVGLHAALGLLHHFGTRAIAERITHLGDFLREGLQSKGYSLLGPSQLPTGAPATARSGIISFTRPDTDLVTLHRRLDGLGIILSARHDPLGRPCLRVSPHFYNTEAELERLLAEL